MSDSERRLRILSAASRIAQCLPKVMVSTPDLAMQCLVKGCSQPAFLINGDIRHFYCDTHKSWLTSGGLVVEPKTGVICEDDSTKIRARWVETLDYWETMNKSDIDWTYE